VDFFPNLSLNLPLCELEDDDDGHGSFLAARTGKLERWDFAKPKLLQTFVSYRTIIAMTELRRDIIISVSEHELQISRLSTGECLHSVVRASWNSLGGLVKLTDRHFATAVDRTMQLWDEDGNNYATYTCPNLCSVRQMAKVADGSIITAVRMVHMFPEENFPSSDSNRSMIKIRTP